MENESDLTGKKPPAKINALSIFILIGFLFGIYLFLPQLGEIEKTINVLAGAEYQWIILALLLQFLTYPASALTLMGVVDFRLPFWLTSLEQLAGTFLTILTPQGFGKIALDEYYLEGFGAQRAKAIGAITMNYVANLIGKILFPLILLAAISFLAHTELNLPHVNLPYKWQYLLGVLGFLTVLGTLSIVFSPKQFRQRLFVSGTDIVQNIKITALAAIKNPVKGLQLFGGFMAIIVLDLLTLVACLYAFGANPGLLNMFIVLLGSMVVTALSPTPGGLGAVEAFLVLGLTAMNIAVTQAIAGVLVFRMLSFWLPILPGYAAYVHFRREYMN